MTFDLAATNDSTGPANESGQTLTVIAVTHPANGTVDHHRQRRHLHPGRQLQRPRQLHLHGPGQRHHQRRRRLQDRHGTVNVTVTEVNDAPVVTAPANQTVSEGGTASISAAFTDVEVARIPARSIGAKVRRWQASSPRTRVARAAPARPPTCMPMTIPAGRRATTTRSSDDCDGIRAPTNSALGPRATEVRDGDRQQHSALTSRRRRTFNQLSGNLNGTVMYTDPGPIATEHG